MADHRCVFAPVDVHYRSDKCQQLSKRCRIERRAQNPPGRETKETRTKAAKSLFRLLPAPPLQEEAMTSRGGVEGGRRRGFWAAAPSFVVCLKHRPRCGPTAHNTASRAASSAPGSALATLSPRGRRLCRRGRYRFQTVAPATVYVRRLNQPRVTQPSADQRICAAPRSSHAYQNRRRRPAEGRRAAPDQAAPTYKKTGVTPRPCRWHG